MKKTLSLLLSVLIILSSFSMITVSAKETNIIETGESYSGTTGDCTWKLDTKTGLLTISGSGYMGNYLYSYSGGYFLVESPDWDKKYIKKVVIEEGVKSIGSCTFAYCTNLTSITIPNSVTTIGNCAFYDCTSLVRVSIPSSVKAIYGGAFSNCTMLTNITIPNSITSIDEYTFRDCTNLTNMNIPSRVTTIGNNAFNGCTGLTDITIPNNVSSIGICAFYDCENLVDINLPDKGIEFGDGAFDGTGCHNDSSNWDDGVFYIGDHLIEAHNLEGDYTVKSGTKYIANDAFKYSYFLENITFPQELKEIGNNAFYGEGLESVTFLNDVKSIGDYAFSNCNSLGTINMPTGSTISYIGVGAFDDTDFYENDKNWNNNSLYLGNNLIGVKNFKGDYIVNNGTKGISAYAFQDCKNITSVTIPNSVLNIGEGIFKNCTSLKSVNIPNGITFIAKNSFENCTNLSHITLHSNIKYIGSDAFRNTDYYNNSNNWEDGVLYLDKYLINVNDTDESYTIKDGTKLIASHAFNECQNLNEVIIPVSVITICDDAFVECDYLENVCYLGSRSQWEKVNVINSNETLLKANFKFVCKVSLNLGSNGVIVSDNNNTVIYEGSTYSAKLTPARGYRLTAVYVIMGNEAIKVPFTKSQCQINIPNVSDNIFISAYAEKIVATGISLNAKSLTLQYGKSIVLRATVEPSDADNVNLLWSSSNERVATVDQNGRITAKGEGFATISVTTKDGSNKYATCNVEVIKFVTSIKLSEKYITLQNGESTTVQATVEPYDATNAELSWSSSDEGVATVDQNGRITAKGEGFATISVTTKDGSKKYATCNVEVIKFVTSIKLSEKYITLQNGESTTVQATVEPYDATNAELSWSSSDESVATVDQDGEITAVGSGTAIIVVEAIDGSDKYNSCVVKVIQPATSVSIKDKSVTLVNGKSMVVKATVTPNDATNKKLKWTTSNSKVATVNASGKITAKGKGTATIKVMTLDGSNKYATLKVTVKQPVTSVKLNKKSANLKVKGKANQKSVTLKATVLPKNADNKAVTWSTSNKKIATVNSKGKVTAKKKGTCYITATAKDGSKKSAKCKITVK